MGQCMSIKNCKKEEKLTTKTQQVKEINNEEIIEPVEDLVEENDQSEEKPESVVSSKADEEFLKRGDHTNISIKLKNDIPNQYLATPLTLVKDIALPSSGQEDVKIDDESESIKNDDLSAVSSVKSRKLSAISSVKSRKTSNTHPVEEVIYSETKPVVPAAAPLEVVC